MKKIFLILLLLPAVLSAQHQKDIPVHDPVMIKQDSMYYLFCTGRGISVWSSKDMTNWAQEKPVFDTLPWAVKTIRGFRNHIWAPDISFHNGLFYLYYSVGEGDKNHQLRVATSESPQGPYRDAGKPLRVPRQHRLEPLHRVQHQH